jgi:hypothetical protein
MMRADESPAQARCGDMLVEALLGGAVATDASAVELDFLTTDGEAATLTLPAGLVARTMLSVLRLLAELRQRAGHGAAEIVHPVQSWRLDHVTAPGRALLTLTTTEGIRMPFLMTEADLVGMAQASTHRLNAIGETRH